MKKLRSKLLLGVAAALGISTAANAAITFTPFNGPDPGPGAGWSVVLDYDGINTGFFGTSGGTVVSGNLANIYAAPLGDLSNFAYISNGQTYELTAPVIRGFSFYLGSVDSFNSISFYNGGSLLDTFTGSALAPPADGDQTSANTNRRYNFNFNGATATRIVLESSGNSMEWDTIAIPSAIPEPATWAMMITGFGLMGAALRRRRQTGAVATA